ncbi:MAG: hypothetical protein MUF35_05745 [Candidatus Nanopelagicales bacterium]|nr:hypothetical protein [Candidatus Nanopelagicales bacterium]
MERAVARGLASGLLLGVGGFQAALAAGAPWGRAAFGGGHPGTLPRRLRATSAVVAPLYLATAALVVTDRLPQPTQRRVYGGLAGLFTVGTVLNGLSRSPAERAIWTPTSALLAASLWRSRPAP